jgi:hypothetical protein
MCIVEKAEGRILKRVRVRPVGSANDFVEAPAFTVFCGLSPKYTDPLLQRFEWSLASVGWEPKLSIRKKANYLGIELGYDRHGHLLTPTSVEATKGEGVLDHLAASAAYLSEGGRLVKLPVDEGWMLYVVLRA